MTLQTVKTARAFQLVAEGAVLATSTRRLSRHLIHKYSSFQQQNGLSVWETPSIMPFNSWMENCFFAMDEDAKPFLLTSEQEETLWEEIISNDFPEYNFLGLSGISQTAARAMEIMVRHKLPWTEVEQSLDREIQVFVQWAGRFLEICSEKQFLTGADLPGFIAPSSSELLFNTPSVLILAGFYEHDPAQADLLSALKSNGAELYALDNGLNNTALSRAAFNDFNDEARAAAGWALDLTLKDMDARVGIVVPGLENHRARLLRIFDHVFHPETITDFSEPENRIFNISLGLPLGRYPLADTAIVFLEMVLSAQWDIRDIGRILSSPFIRGGRTEQSARFSLDKKIRQGNQPWRPAFKVLEMAGRKGKPYHCPILFEIFQNALQMLPDCQADQSPAAWAGLFSRLLASAGWPDSRGLNSFEYQTFQAFKEELSRLSRLEPVLESITCRKALYKLGSLLESRIFQPESTGTRVEILGLLETAGLEFDYLWVLNLSADALPAPSRPNPMLPVDMQRKFKTPGSSPARELDLAHKIMSALLKSSKEIIFSHAVRDNDREILESPFLAAIPAVDPSIFFVHEPADVPALIMKQDAKLTTISDNYGLALTGSRLQGGARAFQDQALCPFKGYAAHRLMARAPEEPAFALTPIDRGNMVHQALMRLWQELNSLEELKEIIQKQALEPVLQEVASLTLKDFREKGHVLFTREFMNLEQKRLINLMEHWLAKELERADFEISALEQSQYVEIGRISIKTRLDRTDRLKDGRILVIDYKTGASIDPVKEMWMGERILEPQLPIYAQIEDIKPSGTVLAQVNPMAFKFHGIISGGEISYKDNVLQTPDRLGLGGTEDIFEGWKLKLEAISSEIQEGYALAGPQSRSKDRTCRYCGYKALCRINEQE